MSFNHFAEWVNLSHKKLAALTKEDFGWWGNSKLWEYSGVEDFDHIDKDKQLIKSPPSVAHRLDRYALKFKRATVVLLIQAAADNWNNYRDDDNPPKLLQTLRDTLAKAGDMARPFVARGSSQLPKQWGDALIFFEDNVIDDTLDNGKPDEDVVRVQDGLSRQYGSANFDELKRVFYRVKNYWLLRNTKD